MMTTTLFVDFGEGFNGGKLNMTVGQLLNTIVGPDLAAQGVPGNDVLEFQSLRSVMSKKQYDYDGDGARGTAADFLALKTDVLDLVARIYEPFNVVVKEAKATNIYDVVSAFHLNDFDPTGEHDAYVFATGIIDTTFNETISNLVGIYGIASGIDLQSGPGGLPGNNDTDESVIVCADAVLDDSLSLGFDAAVGISNVVSHEAGHTFGLRHTTGVASPADQALQNSSDVIRAGGNNSLGNLMNTEMITRYNLMADYTAVGTNFDPAVTVNSYDKLANDPNIGANPNFAYVTGTGAYDDIYITRFDATMALVSVRSYRDATFQFSSSIDAGPYTYMIDYTKGILVDAGRSDDRIHIDASLGVNIRVRGGQGRNQMFVTSGGETDATFTPDSTPAHVPGIKGALGGTITASGGGFGATTITFSEFVVNNSVTIDGFTNLTYLGPQTGHVNLQLHGGAVTGQVDASGRPIDVVAMQFINVANFLLDTSEVLPAENIDTNDIITLAGNGFGAAGLQNIEFRTGRGDDQLIVAVTQFNLPLPGGGFLFDGGDGIDTIGTDADADFVLNDDNLTSLEGGTIQLLNLFREKAALKGGASGNTFYIQSWAGTGTADGGAGNDNFVFGHGRNLDTFIGSFKVIGGTGNDIVTLDDSLSVEDYNYNISKTRVAADSSTPRPFGSVSFESTLETLALTGTLGKNTFFATPLSKTTLKIDGLDPPAGTPPLEGDSLSIAFGSAQNRKLINRGTGAGIWTFTSGEQPIYFQGIEQMGSLVAAAADAGSTKPLVKVYNSLTNQLVYKFYAYETSFKGGVNVTMADVTGDGVLDVVVAPGAGRRGEVKVFDSVLMEALANNPQKLVSTGNVAVGQVGPSIVPEGSSYRSGLQVAAGDVDGDGKIDIITSRLSGSGKVRVFEKTAADSYHRTVTFTPYNKNEKVNKGAVIAAGDVDGDGRDEIITAPGAGASARIKVWEGENGRRTRTFYGFESKFKGGVSLAVGDADGDGRDEIFVGAGTGGGSRVRTFNQYGTERNEFRVYTSGNQNAPVQLAARASDPRDKVTLYTAQGNDGRSSRVQILDPLSGKAVDSFLETAPEFRSGLSMG